MKRALAEICFQAQAQHTACQNEHAEAHEAMERARNNFQTKDSALSKVEAKFISQKSSNYILLQLQSKLDTASEKADVAQRQLSEQDRSSTQLQTEHYTSFMPTALQVWMSFVRL